MAIAISLASGKWNTTEAASQERVVCDRKVPNQLCLFCIFFFIA